MIITADRMRFNNSEGSDPTPNATRLARESNPFLLRWTRSSADRVVCFAADLPAPSLLVKYRPVCRQSTGSQLVS